MQDKKLILWSRILLILAWITVIISLAGPLYMVLSNAPMVLAKGDEIWKTTMSQIPAMEGYLCLFILMLPNFAWVYAVANIAKLAKFYQKGQVFEEQNTRCFIKIGIALCIMGVLSALVLPAVNYLFYYRNITPWLSDMPLFALLNPDLIMAGAFFYVLGKIMQRGAELQDNERLTV